MVSVLFVCLGNICRSPAAEAILRRLADDRHLDIEVSSCGIGDWHLGDLADERMISAAKARGFVIAKRAEQFNKELLDRYDYILASDRDVIEDLYYHARSPGHKDKIDLISAFSTTYKGEDVPDPYYSDIRAFEEVIDMLEDCCLGLLDQIDQRSS